MFRVGPSKQTQMGFYSAPHTHVVTDLGTRRQVETIQYYVEHAVRLGTVIESPSVWVTRPSELR